MNGAIVMPDTTQPDPQPAVESTTPAADVDDEQDARADATEEGGMRAEGAPTHRADAWEAVVTSPPVRVVTGLAELTREPQPLVWADTGEPVGAAVQLIPPYDRRVSRTARGEMVTGVRVSCADGYGRRVHVDLAAAQTRMASVWDDRDTTPVALVQLVPQRNRDRDDDPSPRGEHTDRDRGDSGAGDHAGPVVVTTDPFDYFRTEQTATERYPNLETALVALTGLLDRCDPSRR
jgi:hypothetical protein